MAQSLVNFRLDADLKKEMEAVCQELGMSLTTAFTIYAKKVTREKRIPFDVSIAPTYPELPAGNKSGIISKEDLIKKLDKAEEDYKEGRVQPYLSTVAEIRQKYGL